MRCEELYENARALVMAMAVSGAWTRMQRVMRGNEDEGFMLRRESTVWQSGNSNYNLEFQSSAQSFRSAKSFHSVVSVFSGLLWIVKARVRRRGLA